MRHAANALQVDLGEVWKRRNLDDKEKASRADHELRRELFLGPLHSINRGTHPRDLTVLVPELFAVLLALLPNLKHLAFSTTPTTFSVGVGMADVPPAAMSALGVTKLPLRVLEAGFKPRYLSRVTPDLESLTCGRVGGLEESGFPRLKSLRIRGTPVNRHNLGRIVESCPESLSSFTYEASGFLETSIDSGLEHDVQPSDAVTHLSKFHDTLKSLCLDLRFHTRTPRDTGIDSLPSLEDFTVLEDLFLATSAIYNFNNLELPHEDSLVDILPPNIVPLTLAKTWWLRAQRLRLGLLGLVEHKRCNPERFRKLKFVRCHTKEVCFDSSVKDAFGEVGIDLVYEEFPRQDLSYNDRDGGYFRQSAWWEGDGL
ncbi:hypothetical protein FALCPG4_012260 [Fusarium falciforme]